MARGEIVCGNETIRHWRYAREERFERLIFDPDLRSGPDNVKKFDHVAGAHPDTAVADRKSDVPLLGCAVDVNKAAIGSRILRSSTPQPEYAGDDRIASRSVRRYDLARAASILENGSARRAAADLLRDLERTQRCAAAPGNVAKAELRSRDRVGGERRASSNSAIRCSGMLMIT